MGTPIDIYNPVSSGVSVLPYTLLPEQRNTQLGLYVQDQIRYADRITLVVGGRHDRARSKTEGVAERIDEAWTFKIGLIGDVGAGRSPDRKSVGLGKGGSGRVGVGGRVII